MRVVRLSASQKMALSAMIVALTVLALYAVSVAPTGRLALFFISSLFVYVLCCENAYLPAYMAFFASALLSFLLLPDKNVLIAYVALLGHYGIFWTFLNKKMKRGLFRALLKLLYCDVFAALGYFVSSGLLRVDVLSLLPGYSPWILIGDAQVLFVAYNLVFAIAAQFYDARLRSAILPRK